jgi:hypothetical protein
MAVDETGWTDFRVEAAMVCAEQRVLVLLQDRNGEWVLHMANEAEE